MSATGSTFITHEEGSDEEEPVCSRGWTPACPTSDSDQHAAIDRIDLETGQHLLWCVQYVCVRERGRERTTWRCYDWCLPSCLSGRAAEAGVDAASIQSVAHTI